MSALIWCPFADEASAENVAKQLLDERLVACANILPPMRSLFVWEGNREDTREVGVLFKTDASVLSIATARLAEWATFVPLIGLAVWIGLYPAPFLDRINLSVLKVAARLDPAYADDFAAACDTTVTPEMRAASPAGQFLIAAPCGPDGQPLTPASSTATGGSGGGR